jgi:hydantoinase/carbamoylase family amidase
MRISAIDAHRLRSRIERLAAVGADPPGEGSGADRTQGISRFPYSAAHADAMRLVAGWMADAGLQAGCDEFGNLIGLCPGEDGWPAIIVASHLDSVPHGGIFDGALGVLAGVETAQALRESGQRLRHPLVVIGFADEEGHAFNRGTLASRLLVGDVSREQFGAIMGYDGRTIAEALAAFDPGLPRARCPEAAGAYLELHVEQGPILHASGRRVAAVTGITGMARTTVTLEGEANHAGTTPMAGRKDALVAAAEVVLAVRAAADAAGPPAVGTVGRLTVAPGATNVVPGRTEFTVEFRTPDSGLLTDLCARCEADVHRAASARGLSHRVAPWDRKDPVPLDEGIRQTVAEAIAARGHEPFAMPSGAGHDAMILAPHVAAGMVFVASRDGISHSPREWTSWEDAALGTEVVLRTVLALDARGPLRVRRLPLAYQG